MYTNLQGFMSWVCFTTMMSSPFRWLKTKLAVIIMYLMPAFFIQLAYRSGLCYEMVLSAQGTQGISHEESMGERSLTAPARLTPSGSSSTDEEMEGYRRHAEMVSAAFAS
jgi:hypothetical protein